MVYSICVAASLRFRLILWLTSTSNRYYVATTRAIVIPSDRQEQLSHSTTRARNSPREARYDRTESGILFVFCAAQHWLRAHNRVFHRSRFSGEMHRAPPVVVMCVCGVSSSSTVGFFDARARVFVVANRANARRLFARAIRIVWRGGGNRVSVTEG